ncbi:ATP-binding cassette domain-containing protein [Microtetraspora sp. NBRC 16547]|uniref:energy-coupling factor ABC transporter ATP-binding protein n=1 Tax=Microtetraspora sp. NBRC 16547 TaxID=3030993 RepID=UPI0024A2DAB0|nr:ATP-binding cassette domain-containing protein [Microtetraspora sp. NBRC 16547]GLW99111.1 putative ABC transporter ATP-binding protein [Microtetraspora sp. NBRC 16547]
MTAVLAADRLSYSYPGSPPVFSELSLEVSQGAALAVLGPNGGGKTTLLRLLCGGLRPTAGQVMLHGRPLGYGRAALSEFRTQVQFVHQDPDDQLFAATVGQDVSFGPLNLGLRPAAVAARVTAALEDMEIVPLVEQPTHLLSFGQRKRVAIAGALALRPVVLILDEPTAGLDPAGTEALLSTLRRLGAGGTTIIASTHDVDFAHRWADDVAIIARGALHSGPADRLLTDSDLLRDASLRPAWGPAVGRVLRAVGGLPPTAPDPRSPEEVLGVEPETRP